jgi:poly-beta-1,6-N-acetyl-D-glucosamine synthase
MFFSDGSVLEFVFAGSIFYIGYVLVGYPCLLNLIKAFSGSKKNNITYSELPLLTVVVPCFNEEENIEQKVRNIFTTHYPKDKLEVFFIDNGSTDNTAVFLTKLLESYSFKFFTSPPGKTQALNKAMEIASTDIIVNTDCDTIWSSEVLFQLVQPLAGKDVGAVCATPKITKSLFASKVKYHEGDWVIRNLESQLDSCCSLDGRLMAFKKSALGFIRSGASNDDFEITLALRKKGFKSLALRNVFIQEESPGTISDEIEQIRRRACQGLLSMIHYKVMLFNPKYGLYGVFILTSRRFLPLFLPFSVTVVVGLAIFFWPMPTIIAIVVILLVVLLTGNMYKLLQLYGITLGWFDILFNKGKRDIWTRKTK